MSKIASATLFLLYLLPQVTAQAPPKFQNMVLVPESDFIAGSTALEREDGYKLDETYHNSTAARKYRWFEVETLKEMHIAPFYIDINLVTNEDYYRFVKETGRKAPFVDPGTWRTYRLTHKYEEVNKFLWVDGKYKKGRAKHPVVLVDHDDAVAYCAWRGGRLPTEYEWELAARGSARNIFPWGNDFDPNKLNSYDRGPYDTVPVGHYENGKSRYGLYDMAGQVFEWTSTPYGKNGKFTVRGGSWDDYPGVTRSAARHGRPAYLKHIIVGFRCARTPK
jgi:formylglycine-generating enzyme required for sulfatase activity